ncbi:MAG: hypothetical protein NTX45_18515 [Proteobacteria bacterium]|nr:hypothetical protein [Pseudomonadota bacterium]
MTGNCWFADEKLRYGMAYGFEDIEWAMQTRQNLLDQVAKAEEDAERSLDLFIEKF